MAKRKRPDHADSIPSTNTNGSAVNTASAKVAKTNGHLDVKTSAPVLQIVAGSYERALHGITASVSDLSGKATPSVEFADSFLFNAHDSSIRCLAISPLPDVSSADQGVFLATGGSDEKVNVFSLAASPLAKNSDVPDLPSLGSTKVSENPRNRELGALLSHSSNVTALHFPSRSKLLSASEDNTIAVSRLRDLTTVSIIKVPRPKAFGQPSGDTAPPGATPAGVNDFAIHPSMKLMLSVGRGEKCMRLWNLVTGKKAGVLNFDKNILQSVKEGKYSSGEGRKIRWNPAGTQFVVGFERGVVVFGEDSKARCKILPMPLTKVHHLIWCELQDNNGEPTDILAVSTEDGRIVFYDTGSITATGDELPDAKALAQLGGKEAGIKGRVKDFELLPIDGLKGQSIIVTASSDGVIRLWHLSASEWTSQVEKNVRQVGKLLGSYETGNRITCLRAFVMLPAKDEDEFELSDFEGFSGAEDEDEDGDESEDEK
jgi:protein MAK11